MKQLYFRLIPDTGDNSSKCLFTIIVYNTNIQHIIRLKKLYFNLIINKRDYSLKRLPNYKREKIDMQNIAFMKLLYFNLTHKTYVTSLKCRLVYIECNTNMNQTCLCNFINQIKINPTLNSKQNKKIKMLDESTQINCISEKKHRLEEKLYTCYFCNKTLNPILVQKKKI